MLVQLGDGFSDGNAPEAQGSATVDASNGSVPKSVWIVAEGLERQHKLADCSRCKFDMEKKWRITLAPSHAQNAARRAAKR